MAEQATEQVQRSLKEGGSLMAITLPGSSCQRYRTVGILGVGSRGEPSEGGNSAGLRCAKE